MYTVYLNINDASTQLDPNKTKDILYAKSTQFIFITLNAPQDNYYGHNL